MSKSLQISAWPLSCGIFPGKFKSWGTMMRRVIQEGFKIMGILIISIGLVACDNAIFGNSEKSPGQGGLDNNDRLPSLKSMPDHEIGAGQLFREEIRLASQTQLDIGFRIDRGPKGMLLDNKSHIKWQTDIEDVGLHEVTVQAYDKNNPKRYAQISFNIRVTRYCRYPKKRLVAFVDDDKDGRPKGNEIPAQVLPFKNKRITALENYNYDGFASDIKKGPKGEHFTATHFFFQGKDGLSLFFLYDRKEGGAKNNKVNVDIRVTGNSHGDRVLISDEPESGNEKAELRIADFGESSTYYEGRFYYKEYADGGVIGPFKGRDFEILIEYPNYGNIQFSKLANSNKKKIEFLSLEDSQGHPTNVIFKFSNYGPCL